MSSNEPPSPPRRPDSARSQAPRVLRRLWRPLLAALVLAALAVVVFATDAGQWLEDRWDEATTKLRDLATEVPERQLEEQRKLAGSESLLIIILDDAERAVGFSLLSRSTDEQAVLALIPPFLFDILPGYGDFALADATVFEGQELARLAISNLLGIRIDGVLALRPGDIARSLSGQLVVDLPNLLIVGDPDGSGRIIADAGSAAYLPEDVEILMVTRGTSDSLDWLQRQAAVWQSLLDVIATDFAVPERLAALAPANRDLILGILAGTASSNPQVTVVPVTRVSVAGAEEGFKLASVEAAAFLEARMSHLLLFDGDRPRVEVLNGNGRILTTRQVAEALVRRGFRVIKTDNAENFAFEQTLVISQGRDHRADAERAIATLGTGELQLELRAPSGVVDVSIIVGHDIPAGEG